MPSSEALQPEWFYPLSIHLPFSFCFPFLIPFLLSSSSLPPSIISFTDCLPSFFPLFYFFWNAWKCHALVLIYLLSNSSQIPENRHIVTEPKTHYCTSQNQWWLRAPPRVISSSKSLLLTGSFLTNHDSNRVCWLRVSVNFASLSLWST